MDQKFILRVLAVIHAVTAEGNVGNDYIEIIIRERSFFKAFYLNIHLRV